MATSYSVDPIATAPSGFLTPTDTGCGVEALADQNPSGSKDLLKVAKDRVWPTDIWYLQVSVDHGASWQYLTPTGGTAPTVDTDTAYSSLRICQDTSSYDIHVISCGTFPAASRYHRITLEYTDGHISGWSWAAADVESPALTDSDVRGHKANIYEVIDGNGVHRLLFVGIEHPSATRVKQLVAAVTTPAAGLAPTVAASWCKITDNTATGAVDILGDYNTDTNTEPLSAKHWISQSANNNTHIGDSCAFQLANGDIHILQGMMYYNDQLIDVGALSRWRYTVSGSNWTADAGVVGIDVAPILDLGYANPCIGGVVTNANKSVGYVSYWKHDGLHIDSVNASGTWTVDALPQPDNGTGPGDYVPISTNWVWGWCSIGCDTTGQVYVSYNRSYGFAGHVLNNLNAEGYYDGAVWHITDTTSLWDDASGWGATSDGGTTWATIAGVDGVGAIAYPTDRVPGEQMWSSHVLLYDGPPVVPPGPRVLTSRLGKQAKVFYGLAPASLVSPLQSPRSDLSGALLPIGTPIVSNGIVVSGQVTNLCARSEGIVSGTAPVAPWSKGSSPGITFSVVSGTAPNGQTANLARVSIPSKASGYDELFQQFTSVAGPYTWSVWLRKVSGTGSIVPVWFVDSTAKGVALCTVTTSWQRFTGTGTLTAGTGRYFGIGPDSTVPGTIPFSDIVFEVWGAQVESGSVANPYVPNFNASGSVSLPAGSVTNLCFQSEALIVGSAPNSPWTQSNGGGAGAVTCSTVSTANPSGVVSDVARLQVPACTPAQWSQFYVTRNLPVGTYCWSAWIKSGDGASGSLHVRIQEGSSHIGVVDCAYTTSWQRFSAQFAITNVTNYFMFGNAAGTLPASDALVWGAQLEAVGALPTPGPYVSTGAATASGVRGEVKNLLLQSEAIVSGSAPNSPWTRNQGGGASPITCSVVSTQGPNGVTANIARLQIPATTDAGNYTHFYQAISGSAAGAYRWSVWLKAGSGESSSCRVFFYDSGIKGTTDFTVTNQWQRFSGVATLTGAGNFMIGNSFAVLPASDVLVWGAMVEKDAAQGPSVYVPTTSAQAAIASDPSVLFPCRLADPQNFGIGAKITKADWSGADTLVNVGGQNIGYKWNSCNLSTTAGGALVLTVVSASGASATRTLAAHGFAAGSTHSLVFGAVDGVPTMMVDGAEVGTLSGAAVLSSFPSNIGINDTISPVAKTVVRFVQSGSVVECQRMMG